nr:unnamed protein product [Callosobruchus analis]
MLIHPEAVNNYKFQICIHCNAKFKNKISLDNHTIRYHPNFVASVTRKVHECPCCTYKTTLKGNLHKHMMSKRPDTVKNYKFNICVLCNEKFKSNDLHGHTIRKHPDFIGSITRKIQECTLCPYKSVMSSIDKHMSKHSQITNKHKSNTCSHCNATFKRKESFDDRAVRKHPDLVASISSKTFKKYTLYT